MSKSMSKILTSSAICLSILGNFPVVANKHRDHISDWRVRNGQHNRVIASTPANQRVITGYHGSEPINPKLALFLSLLIVGGHLAVPAVAHVTQPVSSPALPQGDALCTDGDCHAVQAPITHFPAHKVHAWRPGIFYVPHAPEKQKRIELEASFLQMFQAVDPKAVEKHAFKSLQICTFGNAKIESEHHVQYANFAKTMGFVEAKLLSRNPLELDKREFVNLFLKVNHGLVVGDTTKKSSLIPDPMMVRTTKFDFIEIDDCKARLPGNDKETYVDYLDQAQAMLPGVLQEEVERYAKEGVSFTDVLGRANDEQQLRYMNMAVIRKILKNKNHALHPFVSRYYFLRPKTSSVALQRRLARIFTKVKTKLRQERPIEAAAYMHMALVEAHPVGEANGRTARLFSDWVLMSSGLPPVDHFSESEYLTAVHKSSGGQHQHYADYIRARHQAAQAPEYNGLLQSLTDTVKSGADNVLTQCRKIMGKLQGLGSKQ